MSVVHHVVSVHCNPLANLKETYHITMTVPVGGELNAGCPSLFQGSPNVQSVNRRVEVFLFPQRSEQAILESINGPGVRSLLSNKSNSQTQPAVYTLPSIQCSLVSSPFWPFPWLPSSVDFQLAPSLEAVATPAPSSAASLSRASAEFFALWKTHLLMNDKQPTSLPDSDPLGPSQYPDRKRYCPSVRQISCLWFKLC